MLLHRAWAPFAVMLNHAGGKDQFLQRLEITGQEIICVIIFFVKILFIYLFRMQTGGRGKWRGGKNLKQISSWVQSPKWGSIPGPQDHDPSYRQMLNQLRHTCAPRLRFLKQEGLRPKNIQVAIRNSYIVLGLIISQVHSFFISKMRALD